MGTLGSTQKLRPQIIGRPEDIIPLSDYVYQLYPPQGVTLPRPLQVIIFFHGLPLDSNDYTEAFWKTWLSRDGSVVWPKDWLSKRLPNAQILSVSYDSYIKDHDGAMDSHQIATNLISDLILDEHVCQNCPVVLVGHSLGGIIIKEFLLECWKKKGELENNPYARPKLDLIEKFLGNCKGVFYYSTPHGGSRIVDHLSRIPDKHQNPLVKLLTTLSTATARINAEFAMARIGIRTQTIWESFDTTYLGYTGKFVEEASARQDIDNSFYTVPANHFDVCKARNNDWCSIIKNLESFIKTVVEDTGSGLRAR